MKLYGSIEGESVGNMLQSQSQHGCSLNVGAYSVWEMFEYIECRTVRVSSKAHVDNKRKREEQTSSLPSHYMAILKTAAPVPMKA